MTEVRLTDEEIDGLEGQLLNEHVALAVGWTREGEELFRSPGGTVFGWYDMPRYCTNLGAAMSLLMSFDEECSVTINSGQVHVYGNCREVDSIASGPKDQAASVLCRAFLKLKNRS